MAKQQKAKEQKAPKTRTKKSTESQFMAVLSKKVRSAMKQYDYIKDKGAQVCGDVVFSSEQVRQACREHKK